MVNAVPTPDLYWDRTPDAPEAVVLVLHGGQEQSERRAGWGNLAVLRMLPIARSVARSGHGRLAVVRLRYAVRGWNGAAARPLADARRAMDDIAARFPAVPIALVGHSMGGRVAFALAKDPQVSAVVGLAPWIGGGDALAPHADLRLLVLHGLDDRITSPTASRDLVEKLQAQRRQASFVGLRGEKHAMLHRWRTWDRLTAGFLRAAFAAGTKPQVDGSMEQLGARAASQQVMTVT